MASKTLKIGIMPREEYRKRSIAIARGEYEPKRTEPKVWFDSIKSMAQILSSENRELLKVIKERKPASLKELEMATGRRRSNLSRTLNTMQRYGIVEMVRQNRAVRPIVKATEFKVEFGLDQNYTRMERERPSKRRYKKEAVGREKR